MPTFFEHAAGLDALHRLEEAFYTSVLTDPYDEPFREAVRQHVEFGSQVAMQNSHAERDEDLYPLHEVPRWHWAGDQSGDQ